MRRSRKYYDRLKVVWEHGQIIGAEADDPTPWRYVPQSLDGGTGWGVYDNLQQRFVDYKLMTIPLKSLANEKLPDKIN